MNIETPVVPPTTVIGSGSGPFSRTTYPLPPNITKKRGPTPRHCSKERGPQKRRESSRMGRDSREE